VRKGSCSYKEKIGGNLIGRTLLDQYRVESFVASSGMGAVYRATNIQSERDVVLKVSSGELILVSRKMKKRETHDLRTHFYSHFPTAILF
jgi:hypothetical protein